MNDVYGFWDLAGRNLFYKFPKFSFVKTADEDNLDTNDTSNIDLGLGDPLAEALKSQKRKVYIKINDGNVENDLDKIICILPSYLLRNGKYVNGAVELLDEITIGVTKNPVLQKDLFIKRIEIDPTLSKFSLIRPIETLD